MTKFTANIVPLKSWIRAALWLAAGVGSLSCASKPCGEIPCPAPGFDPNTCECISPASQPAAGGNGASAPVACNPLGAETSSVTLDASDIIDAGRDAADGAVYVLVSQSSRLRLFVAAGATLSEQFENGAGQGQTGSIQFWTFTYIDDQGLPVTIEVQKDGSGARMGVVKGPISGKGFDVGSAGDVLDPIAPATAAAMPAQTTQTFHVDYSGVDPSGDDIVVIAPDHATSFDGFRIFYGPPSALGEQSGTVTVTRTLSISSTTDVAFTLDGSPATLQYDSTGVGTLTIGASIASLSAVTADGGVPAGAAFQCSN